MTQIKQEATKMYTQYMMKYGKQEGTKIINRYLDMQINNTDSLEVEFCKQLYALTGKEV